MIHKIFDADTEGEIVACYVGGKTLAQVAKQFYCSDRTVVNILNRHGIPRRPCSVSPHNLGMILNDWNANKPMESMRRTHRFKTTASLQAYVCAHRRQGYAFRYRNGSNKPLPRGCQITGLWFDELTPSKKEIV